MAVNCFTLGIVGDRFTSTEVDHLLKFDPSVALLPSNNDASKFFSFFPSQSVKVLIRRLGANQSVANSCAFLDSIIICSSVTAYLEQAITEACLAHLNSNGVYARQVCIVSPRATTVNAFISFLQRQLKRSGGEVIFPDVRVFEGSSIDSREVMQTVIDGFQEPRKCPVAPLAKGAELVVQQNGCRLFILAKSSALKEVYVRVIAGSLERGTTIHVPHLALHFSVGHVSYWCKQQDAREKCSGRFGVGSVCAIKVRCSEKMSRSPTISMIPIDTLAGFGIARGSCDGHFLKTPRFLSVRIPADSCQDASCFKEFVATIQGISLDGSLFYKAEVVTCDMQTNVAVVRCVPREPEQMAPASSRNRSPPTFSRSLSPFNSVVCRVFRIQREALFMHDYLEVTAIIPCGFLLEKVVQCFSWFDSRNKKDLHNFLDHFLGASTVPTLVCPGIMEVPLGNQDIVEELMCAVAPLCEGLTPFAFLTRYSIQCLDTGFITKWGSKIFVPLLHGFDPKSPQETRSQCISVVSDPKMLALVVRAVDVSCIPTSATSILGPLVVTEWLATSLHEKPGFVQSLVDRCTSDGGFDADEGKKLAIRIQQLRRETLKPFGKLADRIFWCIPSFTVAMWDGTGCAPDHSRKLSRLLPALSIGGWTVQKFCAIVEILQALPFLLSRAQVVSLVASYL